MKVFKFDATKTGIVETDGQLMVLAAETATVEYGEFHSFKTGVGIEIPEGSIGLLMETQPMGQRGVTVTGKLVTNLDLSELRVGILNNSRNAFTVAEGQPIARLLILDEQTETLEESDKDEWQELVDAAKDVRAQHDSTVANTPGKPTAVPVPQKPAEDGSGKADKGKPPKAEDVESELQKQKETKEKGNPSGGNAATGNAGAGNRTPIPGETGGTSSTPGSTQSGGNQPTGGSSSVGGATGGTQSTGGSSTVK